MTLNTFIKEQVAGRYVKNAIDSTSLSNRPQSNNGMHPTADTTAVKLRSHAGRRVMPGVRCFYIMRTGWYILTALLMLPVANLSQEISPAEKLRADERYQNTLSLFREPQIFPPTSPDAEVYRILVFPTFYRALSIRAERSGKGYYLTAKYLSGRVGYDWGTLKGERRRRLSEKEWRKLLGLLESASFWSLPSEEKGPEPNDKGEAAACLDSTGWYLEGVRGGKYHVAGRYCPDRGSFKAVGLYMVELSKLGIDERYLH